MTDQIETWRRLSDCDALAGAPLGDALKAACDEIEQLRQIATTNGGLYRSAERDVSAVIAELSAIDAEMDEFEKRHNPDCECEVIHSTREVVRRIRAVLSAPRSPAAALSGVSAGVEASGGTQEAQETRDG